MSVAATSMPSGEEDLASTLRRGRGFVAQARAMASEQGPGDGRLRLLREAPKQDFALVEVPGTPLQPHAAQRQFCVTRSETSNCTV